MLKKLIVTLVLVLALHITSVAQDCGPGCPICSGAGSATSTLVEPFTLTLNTIWIPHGGEEREIFSARVGLFSWMDIGIGYAFESEKVLWSLRVQPVNEDEAGWRPAIILGTGSVQMGRSDQSIYIQLSKAWKFSELFRVRFSVGTASLLPGIDKLYLLYGVQLFIKERYGLFASFDGMAHHAGISWFPNDWLLVSALLVEMKHPAISLGLQLILKKI